MWLSVVVGAAAQVLPVLTDHPTGLVRIIPYGCTFGSIVPWGWYLPSRRSHSNLLASTLGTTGFLQPPSCSRRQS